MYIIKNALKCIGRSKGRNLLIGIIVLVIAISACLGLSIRQAANSARSEALAGLTVTAKISFDRQSAMGNFSPSSGGGRPDMGSFDKDAFSTMMGSSSSLTLEEYQKYATIDTVSDFYYTLSASLNGGEGLSPVSSDGSTDAAEGDTDTTEDTKNPDKGFGGMGGFPGGGFQMMMGMDSDFTVVGYSSDAAMKEWMTTAKMSSGEVFAEGTEEMHCIISTELARVNKKK